jgi:hypothetical protein
MHGSLHSRHSSEEIWSKGGGHLLMGSLEKAFFDKLPQVVRSNIMDNALELKAETMAPDYLPLFSCKDAQTIKTPTLLVKGELCSKFFHLIIDKLERCLPNKESAIIPDAPHLMHNVNLQAFNKTGLAFLAKH